MTIVLLRIICWSMFYAEPMNLFYSWLMAFVILYTKTEVYKYASVYSIIS